MRAHPDQPAARPRRRLGWLVLLCAGWPLGCQTTLPAKPGDPPIPAHSNAELIAHISDLSYVTAEPAFRAVYTLSTAETFDGDFETLSATMLDEGLIPRRWKYTPDRLVDRGAVGYMICKACRIQTGVNWNLTGLGRYAWRELVYRRIAEPSSEYGYVSGGEFVGILLRADDYLQRTQTPVPRAELGEPEQRPTIQPPRQP
jgi:hypothetical protein